jgi:hypothetical protein
MTTATLTRLRTRLVLGVAASLLVAMPVSAAESAPPTGAPVDCYTLEPGTVGSVDHPTDPSAIVLRMYQGGGFVPTAIAFIETPRFTLYGNDVAIFQGPSPTDADIFDARPAFQCLQLTPDQVDELLTFALGEGGLGDAATDYPNPNITDVGTTVFTIDADGIAKSVSIYALGFEMAPQDQLADRARFEVLADLLADFGATVDGEQPYDVPAYAGMLEEDALEPGDASSMPWPWTDLAHEAFVVGDMAGVVLTPEQVAMVTTVPNGGQALIPVTSPDGAPLRLSVRPSLPHDQQG